VIARENIVGLFLKEGLSIKIFTFLRVRVSRYFLLASN